MNHNRFIDLASVLERSPELYDQVHPGGDGDPRACGTPCCCLGWATVLWGEPATAAETRMGGGEALGLTEDEGRQLWRAFWPREWFEAAGLGRRDADSPPDVDDAVQILRWISRLEKFPLVASGEWCEPVPGGARWLQPPVLRERVPVLAGGEA